MFNSLLPNGTHTFILLKCAASKMSLTMNTALLGLLWQAFMMYFIADKATPSLAWLDLFHTRD